MHYHVLSLYININVATEEGKRKKEGPRRWKRNSDGDNFRPSSDANRRPTRSCSRRWIHAGARAGADVARVGTGGGGKAYMAAARNVEATTCGAALPSPPQDTASEPTVAAPPPAAAVAIVCFALTVVAVAVASTNQSRLIVAS